MASRQAVTEAEFLAEQPYDSSNPEQVNDARKKAGRKERERLEDLDSLLNTEKGRKFLWGFCAAFLLLDPKVPNDPFSTMYNLGQFDVAKAYFLELLRANPQLCAKMAEENLGK